MSTHRHLSHNQPVGFEAGHISEGPTIPQYRCLYCRRVVHGGRMALPSHEAMCEARVIVRRQWAMIIERAKQREERASR
jgi:hypothetical protein